MKASLKAVRIAPKKAQLVAKMIRGKSVPEAMYTLERTNKKAARLFEGLLRSAMANASFNDKQDPQMLSIKLLTVNKAQCYHRGVPMARGRVRPMRKFMSHINMTLGIADVKESSKKTKKTESASQTTKKPVKKTTTSAKAKSPASAKAPVGKTSPKSQPRTRAKSSVQGTTTSTSKSSTSTKKS